MKSRGWYMSIAFACCALAACSTTSNESAGGEYRTFTIAPLSRQGSSTDPASATRMNDDVRSAISETLTGKGYILKSLSEADFVVHVETSFSQDPLVEDSERRSLMIGFYDRLNHDLFWSTRRGRSSSRTMEPERLRDSIVAMLTPLPEAPFQR